MIELTAEQTKELKSGLENPPRVLDRESEMQYVLLPLSVYGRFKSLLTDEDSAFADSSYLAAMQVFGADGWNDPEMDIYDDLDPR